MSLTLKEFKHNLERIGLFKSEVNYSDQPLHIKLNSRGHHNHVIQLVNTNNEKVASLGSVSKFNQFELVLNHALDYAVPLEVRTFIIKNMFQFAMTKVKHRDDYTVSKYEINVAHDDIVKHHQKSVELVNANWTDECDDDDDFSDEE